MLEVALFQWSIVQCFGLNLNLVDTYLVLQIFHFREINEIPLNISELEVDVRGCADNEQF